MRKSQVYNLCLIFFLFSSCSEIEKKEKPITLTYFDIKGFFKSEASRLSQKEALVIKEISKNGEKESKQLAIKNWDKEFDLFTESDINKPSWIASYEVRTVGDTTTYKALTEDLRTREINLIKSENKVKSITIKNKAINKLYESNEYLSYYPDSIYEIIKDQHVKIIGNNNYKILGNFIE